MTFDFQLQYRAVKQNQDADRLSRRPHGRLPDDTSSQKELERIQQFTKRHLMESECESLSESAIKVICERHLVHQVINNHSKETSPNTTMVPHLPTIQRLSQKALKRRINSVANLPSLCSHQLNWEISKGLIAFKKYSVRRKTSTIPQERTPWTRPLTEGVEQTWGLVLFLFCIASDKKVRKPTTSLCSLKTCGP